MWRDISRPLTAGMEVYPGDPGFESRTLARVETDGYRLTALSMSAHCGTHVDAPAHFVAGGKTVEQLDGELFFGPALLLAARSEEDLRRVPRGTRRLLLRDEGLGGLRPAQAEILLAAGVQLLGIDRLSVAAEACSDATHQELLSAEVLVVEGLLLGGLREGLWELAVLPLLLAGAEGAPARAFVRE